MKIRLTLAAFFIGAAMIANANPITRSQARIVAQELVGINDLQSDDVPVSPYYIFSRGEGKGFVIVSGDDTTAPILGYTEQGDYDFEQLPEQLKGMLKAWGKGIAEVQARKVVPAPSMRKARARAIADYKQEWQNVPALIKTHWHQSTPYNNLAPVKPGKGRCMSGCVATAGSQVSYYFRKDCNTELQYNTPTYEYGTPITVSLPKGTPLNWNLMKLSGTGSAKQDSAVAVLMYALGTSAWLTYGDGDGTATSGYNNNMGEAMKGQLGLSYEHRYKDNLTEKTWETLIYNNLKTGRPMLYSGYKDEETGGHSVVLDGYQASTGLYHFNFGWGGQGDGWYTVDNERGMNGFNQYMDLVYNITPLRQNLAGQLQVETVYHKAPTTVNVHVENNGTLDYSGFQLFVNNKAQLPTGQPSGKDETLVVAAGGSADLTLTMNNTTQKEEVYLFLCDKNKNVIDTCHVAVTPTVADLTLNAITVDASDEIHSEAGFDFQVVNNTAVNITATLTNGHAGTFCMPTLQCHLYKYNTATGEWERGTGRVVNNLTFENGQTQDAVFTYTYLEEGALYKASMNTTVRATENTELTLATDKSEVFFVVRASDLTLTKNGRTATVSGRWNEALFRQKATDATVCSYDITGLTQLNSQPVAANPNALFYASAEDTDWLKYDNVVVGDRCQHLVVTSDAEFMPMKAFTATKASFVLTSVRTDLWQGTLVPFAVKAPYGMQVKKAVSYDRNTIEHEYVSEVDPMSVITYLSGHKALNTLEGEEIAISVGNTELSMFDGLLRASTLVTQLNEDEKPWALGEVVGLLYYLESDQTQIEPFRPILVNAPYARMRTTSETQVDKAYCTLAEAINAAYEAIASRPAASQQALEALQAVMKEAEDLLSYRSQDQSEGIIAQANTLKDAVNAFLNASADGIYVQSLYDPTPSTQTRYYNLSGQRLSQHPSRGIIVVVDKGGKTRKLLVR